MIRAVINEFEVLKCQIEVQRVFLFFKKMSDILVLAAVADTFLGALDEDESMFITKNYQETISKELQVDQTTLKNFTNFSATDINDIGIKMLEFLRKNAPLDKQYAVLLILKLLGTSIGTFLLCGYYLPFHSLDRATRLKALKKFKGSKIADLRLLYKVLFIVSCLVAYGVESPNVPHWKAIKYPGPYPQKTRLDEWKPDFLDLKPQDGMTRDLKCDIVIVGSGPGACVIASEMSKDGYSVIVVEKAKYVAPKDYNYEELLSYNQTLEKGGGFLSEEGNMVILAGTNWGGGSLINWSGCLKPSNLVLKEWAERYGLQYFNTPEFQKDMDIISEKIGVSENIKHNTSNEILIEGCEKLGYECHAIPQNTGGEPHSCGWCSFGCPLGVKQSSVKAWLPEASKNGCKFIEGAHVDRIIHENSVARGVVAYKDGIKINISAKIVVSSCGAINSPALLLRSKIKNLNRNVGKHLRLHPVTLVTGIFPDRDVLPFEGSIMTSVSTVSENLDENGYGVKLEIPSAHPAMFAAADIYSYDSASSHKLRMLKYPHSCSIIVLTRDKDSEGTIWIDSERKPRVNWTYGKTDSLHTLQGVLRSIEILLSAGATEIITSHCGIKEFKRKRDETFEETINSKEYKEFINQIIKAGINTDNTMFFSAHQMGSCRMASSPLQGAVNPHGESFDLKNLYICDTSVFPTASGSNPMVTVYGIAHAISKFLKSDLKKKLHVSKL